jgi:hypothetical protein
MRRDGLTKVHVRLGASGESMWAKAITDDLYALRNLPFFAFGLNFGDIVHAPEVAGVREVQTVVRPSGHRTIRVVFTERVTAEDQQQCLNGLRSLGASYERATTRLVAIDIPPDAKFDDVVTLLLWCEAAGELAFETCEARVTGSFGDDARTDAAS